MASYTPISNVLDFNVALKPSGAFPLDPRTMFGSLADAEAAAATASDAGATDTIYYFGQTVTVYENNVAKTYLIQPDASGVGTLVEAGGGSDLPEITRDDTGASLKAYSGLWVAKHTMFNELGGLPAEIKEKFIYDGTGEIDTVEVTTFPFGTFKKVSDTPLTKREMESLYVYESVARDGVFKTYIFNGGNNFVIEGEGYLKAREVYSCESSASIYGVTLPAGLWVWGSDSAYTRFSVPTIDALPEVTEADNGKILVVINGKWQAIEVLPEDAENMTAAQLGRAILNAMQLGSEG